MCRTTREVDARVDPTRARPVAWRRLVCDQSGQDLIEYGLLVVTIGLAGALLFPIISGKLSAGYAAQDSAINEHWAPCNPGVPACP